MEHQWYIKLYRKLLENPISYNIELLWFLSYLLLEVNHTEQDIYRGNQKIHLMPWERIISQRALWERFSISISKVHRFIKILEEEWILEHQWSSSFTIIKLLNWDAYNWIETQTESKKNTRRTREETKQEWKQWEEWKEDISKDIWEQALVVFWKEWVNEVIQIIKESVEEMGWVYKASTRERQYANHIAEKHKDWWQFLEKRKDWKWNIDSIREIIYFSLNPNNSFVKQIINAEDFWNKWADVIMAMRREHIEKQKQHIEKTRHNPTGNPLLNF